MPELPEVETIRRDLEQHILHKTFTGIDVIDKRVLRQPVNDFTKRLLNAQITHVNRRGKALIVDLSNKESLIVQLMMTGQLVLNQHQDPHTRIRFAFNDDQKLSYNDQRVFGQLRIVKTLDELKYFKILGPEPFAKEFSVEYIALKLSKSARPIKTMLMDHTFVAGIGNIYASEILWNSHISPLRPANKIKKSEIPLLLSMIHHILNEAIKLRGSSMRNYRDSVGKKGKFNEVIKVYARESQDCPKCKQIILKITQAGRSTFYCKKCQK